MPGSEARRDVHFHSAAGPQSNTGKENHRGHSAAEPQPNRYGGIKNLRARKRIYGLVVQRTRRKANHGGHAKKQTTENTEDTQKSKPQRTRRTRRWKRGGGGLRWSAQPRGLDGVGTPVQLGIVWLCRRDRRHGKPGGLLHEGPAWQAWRLAPQEVPAWRAWRHAPREHPAWQAWRLAPRGAGMASLAACSTGRLAEGKSGAYLIVILPSR